MSTTAQSKTTDTLSSSSIVRALNHRHECEIPLDRIDIQYGQFGVCCCYPLILLCGSLELKLYDKSKQVDKQLWKSGYGHGFPRSIVWCESRCQFFILSTCRLYSLSIKKVEEENKIKFTLGDLIIIDQVIAEHPWNISNNYLRYITIIEKSQHLFLNRAYRDIELWSIETWKLLRKWPKRALGYGDGDEIRLISCSQDGSYLAMNIWFNRQTCAIDFRRHDMPLSLLNRFESQVGLGLYHKLELRDIHNIWLIIDDRLTLYALNLNSDSPYEEVQAAGLSKEENKTINGYHYLHMRYFSDNKYLLVGMPRSDGGGKLCFFRIN
jgi:hypothetical protein